MAAAGGGVRGSNIESFQALSYNLQLPAQKAFVQIHPNPFTLTRPHKEYNQPSSFQYILSAIGHYRAPSRQGRRRLNHGMHSLDL